LLVVVTVTHAAIDRTKVLLNRRAEASALRAALARYGTLAGSGGLGTAWTPVPAALFVVDQLVHAAVTVVAWWLLLRGAATTGVWQSIVDATTAGMSPATVRALGLDVALGIALAIVNVRAASLLIATLVSPREMTRGEPVAEPGSAAAEPAASVTVDPGTAAAEPPARTGAPDAPNASMPDLAAPVAAPVATPIAGPARIGEAIGVLERLLVVTFVLTGQLAAIGFVVAAKTLARFKQLDDRAFAEYYLLGTLASVSVALGSALLAAAALGASAGR
jgi:hypothetical protein